MPLNNVTRRLVLKALSISTALGFPRRGNAKQPRTQPSSSTGYELLTISQWHLTQDRVFLGGDFWANPMEDWCVKDGAAECIKKGGDRNIHLITHQVSDGSKPFGMSIRVKFVESSKNGNAGFKIGVRSDINDHRSNAFTGRGIFATISESGLTLNRKTVPFNGNTSIPREEILLTLTSEPDGDQSAITFTASSNDGKEIGKATIKIDPSALLGNVAAGFNLGANSKQGAGSRGRLSHWKAGGEGFTINHSQRFGPILWSMYSLSDSRSTEGFVMKLSALTGPLSLAQPQNIELHLKTNGQWKKAAEQTLHTDAWVATFRIPNWDQTTETQYKLVYREKLTDGSTTNSEWTGKIKANPSGRPLRLGALTCQKDYGFPYKPVADNLIKLDPDMLYFSGDQLYENHGGYGLIRDPAGPAILNYLRKYYMFGWAFRDAMKDRPTLVIPDDHDVFQGNIWGEGGAKMKDLSKGASSKGGYREPARMVNVVHITCAAHHPDFYDPKPCAQDISVYYGDMVYGNVSFAVLGDRQWKSGPEHVDTGSGRADHVLDRNFDCKQLDKPGLELLGERQESFLKHWSSDWNGHSMKVLLSQTVFAGVATHHGKWNGYLKADLDSGGWPQTPRNNAIDIIRASKALHICGDQHLVTLSQYGVTKQRDSNWAFCTPAIAAGYPRWWRPDEMDMPHKNRPRHGLENTGEYQDGLGNNVYVYAVGNPEVGTKKNRYELAHQKGSGFGLVTIDPKANTYHLEAFRFLIDATDGNPGNQFPGWPVTIHQEENAGQNRIS